MLKTWEHCNVCQACGLQGCCFSRVSRALNELSHSVSQLLQKITNHSQSPAQSLQLFGRDQQATCQVAWYMFPTPQSHVGAQHSKATTMKACKPTSGNLPIMHNPYSLPTQTEQKHQTVKSQRCRVKHSAAQHSTRHHRVSTCQASTQKVVKASATAVTASHKKLQAHPRVGCLSTNPTCHCL